MFAAARLTATRQVEPPRQARALAQRAVEHPAGQVGDQAGALGQRHELAGREQAARRVLPAHERLDADHRAGAQRDLRLVVQDELVLVDRAAQLGEQRERARASRGRGGVVVVDRAARGRAWPRTSPRRRAAASARRRSVHRGRARRRRSASSSTATPRSRRAARARAARAATSATTPRSGRRQQDGELVAAEARQRVAARGRRARAARRPRCSSSSPWSWPSVSLTSLKRSRSISSSAAVAVAASTRSPRAVQQRAVRQAGQRVVQRLGRSARDAPATMRKSVANSRPGRRPAAAPRSTSSRISAATAS